MKAAGPLFIYLFNGFIYNTKEKSSYTIKKEKDLCGFIP